MTVHVKPTLGLFEAPGVSVYHAEVVWRKGRKIGPAIIDPDKGLGYLSRGCDVPRTFEQSVRRARNPRRRVARDGNWRCWA